MKVINCSRCMKEINRTSNHQKFCTDCIKVVRKEYNSKWREEHKDYFLQKSKEDWLNNKEKIQKKSKIYHLNNKDKVLSRMKEYRQTHKDYFRRKWEEYYKNNREDLLAKNKIVKEAN